MISKQSRTALTGCLAAVAMLAAGCASATSSAPAGAGLPAGLTSGPASSSHAGAAATNPDEPSAASRMVCEPEAVNDIYAAVRVRTSNTPTASWRDQLYSCRYGYPAGAAMVLSVKELPTEVAAVDYFNAMQRKSPGNTAGQIAGEPAFTASTGSVFVRKDSKVLQVDVSRLPARFGQPPYPRAVVAGNVASAIMGCWAGG